MPIAERPVPLARIAGALVGQLNSKAVRQEDKARKRRCTTHGNILTYLATHATDAGSDETNLVGTGFCKGNFGILLVGVQSIAERPAPLVWVACTLVGQANYEAIGLEDEVREGSCTTQGYGLADRNTLAAGTGCLQANFVGAGLGEGDFRILKGRTLAIAERPVPLVGVTCALIGELEGEAVWLEHKGGGGGCTTHGDILADLVAHTANTGRNQADAKGARRGIGHQRVLLAGCLAVTKIPIPLGGVSGAQVSEGHRELICLSQKQG